MTSQLPCFVPTLNSKSSLVMESQYYVQKSARLVAKLTPLRSHLIHHHHRQEIADGGEEESVQVVFNMIADCVAEDVENDLSDDEEEKAKGDVPQRPSILERVGDEDDLHDDVYQQADAVDDIQHHKKTERVGRAQSQLVLERQNRYRPRDEEHADGGASQQPHRLLGAIFVQLKAHKAIDDEARAQGGCESVLQGGEIGVGTGPRGNDAGVQDERSHGQHDVDVEEGGDLFTACRSEPPHELADGSGARDW